MQWRGRRQSTNVEDRRGQSGGSGLGGGLLGGILGGLSGGSGGGNKAGCGTGGIIGLIIMGLIAWKLGIDPAQFIGMVGGSGDLTSVITSGSDESGGTYTASAKEQEMYEFMTTVLAETEDVWSEVFRGIGKTYRNPKLVIYNGYTTSSCGAAQSSTGPFYCPEDEKIYLDLSFFDEMETQFKAGGDFAYAYVLAHEVGHHVQKLLGTLETVNKVRAQSSEKKSNELSVRIELQADFYAGIWAYHTKQILDAGDIDEALNAAEAVGDDRLQKQAQGYVVPDSFTHGTSAQRHEWFYKGYNTGDMTQGNTFQAKIE
ncbi:MAG: zinc metallopeptidase [Dysgonamonadaceae bacterium]|jgi:predicted metalloprotease|nr:zinc metallopeptidase [Dysgonamonadaceae bacterium]